MTISAVMCSGVVVRLVSVVALICMVVTPCLPLPPGVRPGSDTKGIAAGIGLLVVGSLLAGGLSQSKSGVYLLQGNSFKVKIGRCAGWFLQVQS